MEHKRHTGLVASLSIAVASVVLAWPPGLSAQRPNAATTVNWPLHNLDLAGTRFSPMDQINRANVKSLTPRWLFQHGVIDGVSNQTTPIVIDGTMYVTDSRGSVYAVDAADGHLLWTYDVTNLLGGGAPEGYVFRNRGVVYANGVIYAAGGSFLFALDAKTGTPLQGFGNKGQASVIMDVLKPRYPDVKTAISMGYWFTTAPQIYDGTLYIGSTRSESHIPGGHVLAVDAETGKVRWKYQAPHPMLAGVTPTAGGLVFAADLGGQIYAMDTETGKILWQTDAGQSTGGGIGTYRAGGRQLIGVASGMKSPMWPGGAQQSRILVYGLR